MTTPDEKTHQKIKNRLHNAGWSVQMFLKTDQASVVGLAVRDFPLARGYGSIDYLLFIDGKAIGLIEVKNQGDQLCGIPVRCDKYSRGLPFSLRLYTRPLPFLYQTNGNETCFTNAFDPEPGPRILHGLHQPETLRSWLSDGAVGETPRDMAAAYFPEYRRRGRTFHERALINMPDLVTKGISSVAVKAVQRLEDGLRLNKRRILITLDKGSERRIAMHLFMTRLLRFVDARRILILLDEEREIEAVKCIFQEDISAETGRPFIDLNAKICLLTLGMLDNHLKEKGRVVLPIEAFEVIVIDECSAAALTHERWVLEYFDACIIGLSETPDQKTRYFFSQEFPNFDQEEDGLNVLS